MFKILIPVDGSEYALRAVAYVIEELPLARDAVELHVLNVQPPIASGNVKRFISRQQLDQFCAEEGQEALATARAKLDAAGVRYQHHVSVGSTAETITGFANEKQCRMVVMGARGLGAVSGLLLGSVATNVIQLSPIPVLVVK